MNNAAAEVQKFAEERVFPVVKDASMQVIEAANVGTRGTEHRATPAMDMTSILVENAEGKTASSSVITSSPTPSANHNQLLRAKIEAKCVEWKTSLFPEVPELDIAALRSREEGETTCNDNTLVFADIRSPEERQVATIVNSLSQQELEEGLAQGKFKNCDVLCFCTLGYRSGLYAKTLMKKQQQREDEEEKKHSPPPLPSATENQVKIQVENVGAQAAPTCAGVYNLRGGVLAWIHDNGYFMVLHHGVVYLYIR